MPTWSSAAARWPVARILREFVTGAQGRFDKQRQIQRLRSWISRQESIIAHGEIAQWCRKSGNFPVAVRLEDLEAVNAAWGARGLMCIQPEDASESDLRNQPEKKLFSDAPAWLPD